MSDHLHDMILIAGMAQLCVLVASALVPIRLDWKNSLHSLSSLHRQLYWVYGGYVVLSIISLAIISICNARELAHGSGLARGFLHIRCTLLGFSVGLARDSRRQRTPASLVATSRISSVDRDVRLFHIRLRVRRDALAAIQWQATRPAMCAWVGLAVAVHGFQTDGALV